MNRSKYLIDYRRPSVEWIEEGQIWIQKDYVKGFTYGLKVNPRRLADDVREWVHSVRLFYNREDFLNRKPKVPRDPDLVEFLKKINTTYFFFKYSSSEPSEMIYRDYYLDKSFDRDRIVYL